MGASPGLPLKIFLFFLLKVQVAILNLIVAGRPMGPADQEAARLLAPPMIHVAQRRMWL